MYFCFWVGAHQDIMHYALCITPGQLAAGVGVGIGG